MYLKYSVLLNTYLEVSFKTPKRKCYTYQKASV